MNGNGEYWRRRTEIIGLNVSHGDLTSKIGQIAILQKKLDGLVQMMPPILGEEDINMEEWDPRDAEMRATMGLVNHQFAEAGK